MTKTSNLTDTVSQRLEKLLPKREGLHFLLFEGAHYSLMSSGKRLRPLFLLHTLEDFAIPIDKGLDIACALEMIHTYSLIHDDLPSMDNDDIRRGKPTLHKVYGEGQAILIGDFLLTYAFEILATCGAPSSIIATIAQAAGGNGMIGGQLIDLLFQNKKTHREVLEAMYLGKTAALFSAALECGAILSNATPDQQQALKESGTLFGIAYQMHDDILDAASDRETGKLNCVSFLGKEEAEKQTHALLQKAQEILPPNCENIRAQMRSILVYR